MSKVSCAFHREVMAVAATLILNSCNNSVAEPSAAGFTVEAVARGYRFSAAIIHGDTAFSGRQDGFFEATSISTGDRYWQTRLTTPQWASNRLSDGPGLIYVGVGSEVVAIARADGAVAWRFSDPTLEIVPTSSITNNGRYVAFAQNRGMATVLDALTGRRVWQRRLLPDLPLSTISAPVFVDSMLIYSRREATGLPPDGEVIAFGVKAATGDSTWTLQVNRAQGLLQYGGISNIRFGDRALITTKDGLVLKVHPATGAVEWKTKIPATSDTDILSISAVGNRAFVGSVAKPGVESLDANTGRSNWSLISPIGSPAFDLGVGTSSLAFLTYGAQLAIVNLETRSFRFVDSEELTFEKVPVNFLGSPALVGDRIVVATNVGLMTLRPK